MRTLKDVRRGLENIVGRTLQNQKGNGMVALGIGLMAVGMIGLCTYVTSPSASGIPDAQPYANGSTVQGVVLAERAGSIDGKYVGKQGTTVDGYELVLKTPDGRCYGFGTIATRDEAGTAVSGLENKIKVGTEVEVKAFNPNYKGVSNCASLSYHSPVTPSQIEVVER